ncbi:MAG: shikimate dehydrogenase [Thermoproteota archaeon]|nr:shikimate dehydrogenase [Thermoproteota archaeon]
MEKAISTYCIIGDPISHSLSPALHNAAFASLGLDHSYIAFRVPKYDLANAVMSLRSINIAGFNVTMPHKVEIIKFLDTLDSTVERTRAVNTVYNNKGNFEAFNTDIIGFITPLRNRNVDFNGMTILLLGAGGTAQSVVAALAEEKGISKIYICSRNKAKLEHLAEVATRIGLNCITLEENEIHEFSPLSDMVINATPMGMGGEESPISYKYISKESIIYDIVYRPMITDLISNAKKANAHVVYGYEMLIEQAVVAFKIWTGITPPVEPMKKALFGGFGEPL